MWDIWGGFLELNLHPRHQHCTDEAQAFYQFIVGLTQGEALSVCFFVLAFACGIAALGFGLWPSSVMSSADVDPQHSWGDDVSDDMSVVSVDGPPSYAQMARPGRRPRVLSQEDDYIMKNEARLSIPKRIGSTR